MNNSTKDDQAASQSGNTGVDPQNAGCQYEDKSVEP